MKNMFNPNIKANYLQNPNFCPHCNNLECLVKDGIDSQNDFARTATQEVYCEQCEKHFLEVFHLADIEPVE